MLLKKRERIDQKEHYLDQKNDQYLIQEVKLATIETDLKYKKEECSMFRNENQKLNEKIPEYNKTIGELTPMRWKQARLKSEKEQIAA